MLLSQASADGVRSMGAAQAEVTRAKGAAEAETLEARAAAFANFTEASKLRLVLDALPALAAEVCAPLAKTKEIVLIGEGNKAEGAQQSVPVATLKNLGRDFMRMSATVPPSVRAITNVDLTKVCSVFLITLCLDNSHSYFSLWLPHRSTDRLSSP